MPFIQKILFPLTDHVDTSAIVHKNILEGEGDRIALKSNVIIIVDDFNDNDLNTDIWNEVDSGSNITETNQRLECKGNNSWNANGLVTDTTIPTNEWRYTITPVASDNIGMFGPNASSSLDITTNGIQLFPASANDFYVRLNGASFNTGNDYIAGDIYKVRIVYQNPGWNVYVQSDDDATYNTEVLIYTTATDSTGPFYFHINMLASTGGVSHVDDVQYLGYSSESPSPVTVQTALPVGSVVDMSTSKCWMFKDGIVQPATNIDVKFKYAINNGSLSSALTLSELRAIDLTSTPITDVVDSFQCVGVYASDGTYESKSSAWLEVNVTFPEGAGAGGKYDKFAKSGIRRVYA